MSHIDTNALYKLTIDYLHDRPAKRYAYYDRSDNNSYPYTSYFKFYGNGKMGLFIILKKDTANLTRETFNPLNAKMGYYSFSGNIIKTKVETVNDCRFHFFPDESLRNACAYFNLAILLYFFPDESLRIACAEPEDSSS